MKGEEYMQKDIEILRELGKQKAELAFDKKNEENRMLWTAANDLHMVKPPIYINEVCWNEMNVENELTLRTEDTFCRKLEEELRREIYSMKHMPGNMVITPDMECELCVEGEDFGIVEDVETVETDKTNDVISRHFNIQIENEEDILKIKNPAVSVNHVETDEKMSKMQEIFEGILEVSLVGKKGMWFTPWDNLIRWTGVEPVMYDLIERPEYIEKLVERYVEASISLMNQYKKLGIWASNNNNTRVGSGGYGYTQSLACAKENQLNAAPQQLWGCGNAQIFSSVSEQMHWDFSLKYELKWLEQFGLVYYGCCEPLHNKMNILEKIPNLRKISASPWCNLEEMHDRVKGKYVLSCKPSPAVFTASDLDEEAVRKDLKYILDNTKDCDFEIILKDISTVRYRPQNLWRWCEIADEMVNHYYG